MSVQYGGEIMASETAARPKSVPEQRNAVRYAILIGSLGVLALGLAFLSLAVGPVEIAPADLFRALSGGGDAVIRTIVLEIRLPRAILAAAIGGTLALSGAALQGLLRNPLAEPGILGASNAAALGAVVALYFGFAETYPISQPLAAVAGTALSVWVLLVLAGRDASVFTLILAGIALSSLAGSLVSLALNLAPSPFAALEITFWLLGSLQDRSMDHVAIALPLMFLGVALLLVDRRALDALTLGEDVARSLGVDLRRTRLRLVSGIAIGVGGAVAVAGAIGFLGLVVPHLIRPLVGHEPGRVHVPSLFAGAALLTAADMAARIIPANEELKLGVLTSLVGIPFFLYLLFATRRRMR